MINYIQILMLNYPNTNWSFEGDAYEGLTWQDSSPKPTQAELDALWESTKATVAAEKQAKEDIRNSALAKLAALGLTQDEVKALLG